MVTKKKLSVKEAIQRPVVLTKAAGMSVAECAQKHKRDKGLKGQQARSYFILQKIRKE